MHKNISLECRNGKDLEKEANEFASAFLMPEFDVRSTAVKDGSLETYIKLKKRWKVSLSALIFRLNKLGMLSDWRYHSLFKQLSIKGMKKKEKASISK